MFDLKQQKKLAVADRTRHILNTNDEVPRRPCASPPFRPQSSRDVARSHDLSHSLCQVAAFTFLPSAVVAEEDEVSSTLPPNETKCYFININCSIRELHFAFGKKQNLIPSQSHEMKSGFMLSPQIGRHIYFRIQKETEED